MEEGNIIIEGFSYEYKKQLAKHKQSICLGTKEPDKYCNGLYLYSDKDPGSGLKFVVTKTNNPEYISKYSIKEI